MFVFGLAGLAFGAFGMLKVDKGLVTELWRVETGLANYTASVADGVDAVVNATRNITTGLDALRTVVLVDVNTTGIKADVRVGAPLGRRAGAGALALARPASRRRAEPSCSAEPQLQRLPGSGGSACAKPHAAPAQPG
jgi:hypothetical protein